MTSKYVSQTIGMSYHISYNNIILENLLFVFVLGKMYYCLTVEL